MLKELTVDSTHYTALARVLWNHGRHDILKQLGWTKRDAEVDHQVDPEAIARDVEELGPAYIKLAQLASTRTDALSAEFVDAFSRLQDDVKPVAPEEVIQIIEADLGGDIDSLFSDFQQKPLAAASLGQVHLARVAGEKNQVVVKVQRPGVKQEATEQIESLRRLAAIVDQRTEWGKRFQFESLAGAVDHALRIELDYQREVEHLHLLHECAEAFDRIQVPRPIEDYNSTRVLTMEFVPGTPIKDLSDSELQQVHPKELADQLVHFFLKQLVQGGFFHADPHPGNLFLTSGKRLALLDAGLVVRLSTSLKHNVAALLLAITERDGERAAEIACRISHTPDSLDVDGFRNETARVVASYGGAQMQNVSLASAALSILNTCGKYGVVLPFEITLLCKTFVQLEMTLARLNPELDIQAELRQSTMRLLRVKASDRLDLNGLLSAALDTTALAVNLPGRIDDVTRLAASNGLRLKIDAIDEAQLLAGLRKIANRITCGLVLAAMIVGACLVLSRSGDGEDVGWVSVQGFAFMMLALSGGLGLILIWHAMFSDKY